jgi:transcriptional regulator with XRE-family HTH domain
MKRKKTIFNHNYSDLIRKLCQERKRLGITQTEVASYLNMTQSEISKIETTERRLDILEFKELLSIYRVDENSKLKNYIIEFLELQKE